MDKKLKINKLIELGHLISPDILEAIDPDDFPSYKFPDLLYLNSDLFTLSQNKDLPNANWLEFEKTKALSDKGIDTKPYSRFISFLNQDSPITQNPEVNVITSFKEFSDKKVVQDFTLYFNSRLDALQKILFARDELKGTTSINRILSKRDRENVSLIGLVSEKKYTKNNNLMLTLEDSTGMIKVLVNKNKPELFEPAKDLVLDEVIGISGVNGQNIVFANNLFWPDIPQTNELKKSNNEGYALFLSDIHIGSDNFIEDDFNRFLSWINQEVGSEKQKETASKVKYIFIVGDLVDGVGIYPGQEEELHIPDIYKQYERCVELLSKIPSNINIIVCAGNHDASRMAEPQPPLSNEFTEALTTLPNITLVSNPSVVNIHSSDSFPGYNVLLYHGYSFDYYIANVDSIRNNGGYDRADLVMKFLLKRRHLAPTHTSTLYIPYTDIDPLVISTIPDFFVTGHVHKSVISNYRNITLICGSCWQAKTSFQEKVGHNPEPSRVPIINLANRQAKILRFGK